MLDLASRSRTCSSRASANFHRHRRCTPHDERGEAEPAVDQGEKKQKQKLQCHVRLGILISFGAWKGLSKTARVRE